MDGYTVIVGAVAVAFIWWLIATIVQSKGNKQVVVYTDTTTGEKKREVKIKRKSQQQLEIEKPEPFEITDEIKEVLDILESTHTNVFLTGKAGTGKSTLLRYFRATTKKYPVVVAPTGVAAVNVQGQTVHSFFGFGIDITPERVRRVSYEKSQVYRRMKMLIIDEISMVRADMFEGMYEFGSALIENQRTFTRSVLEAAASAQK